MRHRWYWARATAATNLRLTPGRNGFGKTRCLKVIGSLESHLPMQTTEQLLVGMGPSSGQPMEDRTGLFSRAESWEQRLGFMGFLLPMPTREQRLAASLMRRFSEQPMAEPIG